MLSCFGCLKTGGHLALLPLLLGASWYWLAITAPRRKTPFRLKKARLRRPLALIYVSIAVLSLVAGACYVPWSFDATTYRLPRLLYWWAAHRWYWIGTLDHRLDFSSCGFEWQALPLLEFFRTDRVLFLINWIPFLLCPGLIFFVFRNLGASGRSARRWMWLFPTAYCVALQCSGIQNDGYPVNYVLASAGLAVLAYRQRRLDCLLMAGLAAGLLTGAKVSNLPLLLPLGVLMLPALTRVRWCRLSTLLVSGLAILSSCLPLMILSVKETGDWTGDPADQWKVKNQGWAAGLCANLFLLANDAVQPPLLPGSHQLEPAVNGLNQKIGPLLHWFGTSHRNVMPFHLGDAAYEGGAGPGFGIAFYTLFLAIGCWLVTLPARQDGPRAGPLAFQAGPWCAWLACAVLFMKLGSEYTPRIAAPFYPLMLLGLVRVRRVAALERTRIAGAVAGFCAATVIPVIVLTPARPLFPVGLVSDHVHSPFMQQAMAKYRVWQNLRDDLAPMRQHLPEGATVVGYAGGFRDTSYGLWKPFGSRQLLEIGLPTSCAAPSPPEIQYAVVTERGIRERYGKDFHSWCEAKGATIEFQMERNEALSGSQAAWYETWYLVKFTTQQPGTN